MLPLLVLESVSVCIENKAVVRDVNLRVSRGELHVIMGPNGAGKSSLLHAVMGLSHTRVCNGRILFEKLDITNIPSFERAKMGISLAHQTVPIFRGIKLSEVVRAISSRFNPDMEGLSKALYVEELMERDLFYGFSGGERKRTELYLTLLQKPKLALLDEPDSEVDVDTLGLLARLIDNLVSEGKTSVILVTHSDVILEKLQRTSMVHVMVGGFIVYSGAPHNVVPLVLRHGYRKSLEVLRGETLSR